MAVNVFLGPMWAGKSTALLREYTEAVGKGKSALMIKHGGDNRYSNETVKTHDGIEVKADIVTMGLENLKIGADVEAVFVDEAHFFTGVKAFACECAMRGIEVFFAGLYGRGTPAHSFFAEMAGLLVVADNVRFLKADCAECKAANTAIFSRFITTDPRIHQMMESGEYNAELVGGAEKYRSFCRKCLPPGY